MNARMLTSLFIARRVRVSQSCRVKYIPARTTHGPMIAATVKPLSSAGTGIRIPDGATQNRTFLLWGMEIGGRCRR